MNNVIVESRNATIDAFVRKMADLLFTNRERKQLETELGIAYSKIAFSLREYLLLSQRYPMGMPQGQVDTKYYQFYKYALTIAIVFDRLRSLNNLVLQMDAIGLESVLEQLKANFPHPLFVPWFVLEHIAEFGGRLHQQDFKFSALDRLPAANANSGVRYLAHFPVMADLMAITQGLRYLNLELDTIAWSNNGQVAGDIVANHAQDDDVYRNIHHIAVGDITIDETADAIVLTTMQAGILNQSGAVLRPAELQDPLCHEFADVFRRSGLQIEMFKTFSEIMKQFHARLVRTPLGMPTTVAGFVTNMKTGPMLDDALKCGPGMQPRLRGYRGEVLTERDSIVLINGHPYVTAAVDISQSDCIPQVSLDQTEPDAGASVIDLGMRKLGGGD